MESLLEQQRRHLEERERLMEAMVHEMMAPKKAPKENINSDHRVRMLFDRYIDSTEKAKELFADKDGARRDEVAAMGEPNAFNEFYNRLKQIKEFHKKHPNEIFVPMMQEFAELDQQRELGEDLVMFTDEEGYGRFLDLHEHHTKYINLKGVEKMDYLTYLSVFDRLFEIPKERKNAAYKEYLESLLNYFGDYIARIKPLIDINDEIATSNRNFEKLWKEGAFPGWPKEQQSALAHSGAHLDLSAFSSWQELSSLGLDRLKSALMALGLKCGGTLEERAQRLFSTKGKRVEEIDASLFAKAQPEKTAGKTKDMDKFKDLACLEAQLYHVVELVSEQRAATKENVTRKQARGLSELAGEEEEETDQAGASAAKDDADDDEVPYNPKNLPLDWNGKPIPYWLYKLHGLNMYFTCEICGNYTYRGPKAFQLHFSEWRHAHGMRCLGIPNTAHFANVTQIEDALSLWERIKVEKEVERFKNETEEECEDSMGNVINRKTYEDLRRQGLL